MDPSWFELSMEQQLELERVRREAPKLPREALENLAVSAAQLAMQRQNIIAKMTVKLAESGGL